MNLKHISLLTAALALLTLSACKKPEQRQDPTPEATVEGVVEITSNPLDAALVSSGGTATITFTANKEWEASSSADWLQLSATKGSKGNNTLTVTADANDTPDSRSATVSITCGTDTKRVAVNQAAKADEPGDEPGENPTPSGNDDLTCPTPPTVGTVDQNALVGYGAAVTGGAGGNVLHFNNGKALQTWLLQRTKDEKKGPHRHLAQRHFQE